MGGTGRVGDQGAQSQGRPVSSSKSSLPTLRGPEEEKLWKHSRKPRPGSAAKGLCKSATSGGAGR